MIDSDEYMNELSRITDTWQVKPGEYFRYQNVDQSWAICDAFTMEVIANCASEMDAVRIIQGLTLLHKMENYVQGDNSRREGCLLVPPSSE